MSDTPIFDKVTGPTPIFDGISDDDAGNENVAGDFVPSISARIRTVAYFAVGIGAAVVGLATIIAGIWFPDVAGNVAASGVAILTFLGTIAGIFGVKYRPTKYQVIK